jgi:hypothetical protein
VSAKPYGLYPSDWLSVQFDIYVFAMVDIAIVLDIYRLDERISGPYSLPSGERISADVRALMRVQDSEAHNFYECEAAECSWTKEQLERQIQSSYFQRFTANRDKSGLVTKNRKRLPGDSITTEPILKTLVGNGVFGGTSCFRLIGLKVGKLTHADVGQMDRYVRLF